MTTLDLIGCDGSVWHLLDPESPVFLGKGMGGLHLFNTVEQWASAANRTGGEFKGSTAGPRSFTFKVVVADQVQPYRTGNDWRVLDAQFWQALSTDSLSQLVFNNDRVLNFRLGDDNEFDFDKDPALMGKAVYPITAIADKPEWVGTEQVFPFDFHVDNNVNFFGGLAGLGPPFIISEAALFRRAYVANPGDLESYGVWKVTGPCSSFRIGVGGHIISPPFPLNDGDVVTFDTENETIMDPLGNSLWDKMGSPIVDFAPIPPGDLVPIEIGMEDAEEGAGITLTVKPRYRRAWGVRLSSIPVTPGGGGSGFGSTPFGSGPFGG